jgi:hypothetical protein
VSADLVHKVFSMTLVWLLAGHALAAESDKSRMALAAALAVVAVVISKTAIVQVVRVVPHCSRSRWLEDVLADLGVNRAQLRNLYLLQPLLVGFECIQLVLELQELFFKYPDFVCVVKASIGQQGRRPIREKLQLLSHVMVVDRAAMGAV